MSDYSGAYRSDPVDDLRGEIRSLRSRIEKLEAQRRVVVRPVAIRPVCADRPRLCSCPACFEDGFGGCPNHADEPGVPVCSDCIAKCDLSDSTPSLRDEVAELLRGTSSGDRWNMADDFLAVVRRHVEESAAWHSSSGDHLVLRRDDVLRLLGGDQ